MATPTDAQLDQIADVIFVMRDRKTTPLPKPVTSTGSPAAAKLSAALDWIGTDPDLGAAGIGVIDFTADAMHPLVWMHNGDLPFRIGSASKIAMMLAAVQLRLDVRKILDLHIVSTPAEFDALFSNRKLWSRSKSPRSEMLQIADPAAAPQISKIFDFTKHPVDFFGPDPKQANLPAHKTAITSRLTATGGELTWEMASTFAFSERFWLTGSLSDNVAATACVAEIGVPYIKAVLRSYGLADLAHGMSLYPTSGYAPYPDRRRPPPPSPPRPLTGVDPIKVNDWWRDGAGGFTDNRSWVPGSAAALAAFMTALMTDAFADAGGLVAGLDACQDIRANLADGGAHAIFSFLINGVDPLHTLGGISGTPATRVTRQINKIGILKKSDGAKSPLVAEFAYVETLQNPAPAPPHRSVMKYAVVAVGLISDAALGASQKSEALGIAVHNALLTL